MRLSIIAAVALAVTGTTAFAHPEGGEDDFELRMAIQRSIPEQARQAVVRLVSQSRLPATWARIQPASSVQRSRNGAVQWVVTFRNDTIRNPAQRILYVIMTSDGTFVSANYRL